jgi:DNA polymerase III alpha subunit
MELCLLYLQDPNRTINRALVDNQIKFDEILELENAPELVQYNTLDITVEQFDNQMQSNWLMPEQYKTMDIAQYVLNQCQGEAELQRAGEELILFQERDMFVLLRYLKYLVDTMRENNILWGVGRGSSVASYVLFLIGVHSVDSIKYNLDWQEVLR